MDEMIKKIRYLALIALSLIMIETVIGFGLIISGFRYRGMEKERAENKLEYIRQTDKEYYKKITSEEDSTYREQFYKQYEKRGNSLLLGGGLLLLALAFHTAIPLGIMLKITVKSGEGSTAITEEKTAEGKAESGDF